MKWLAFLLACAHLPVACTVWSAYRLTAALTAATPEGSRVQPAPFEVAAGQILDRRPADLEQALSLARQAGSSFLILPRHDQVQTAGEPAGVAASPPSLELAWLEVEAGAAPAFQEIDPALWQVQADEPLAESGTPAARSKILFNPSRDWLNSAIWARIQHLYLSLTYPRLRLLLLSDGVDASLAAWDRELIAGAQKPSAAAACGLSELAGCLNLTSIFVQLTGPASAGGILRGLHQGSTYVALLPLGAPRGFSFHAVHQGRSHPMGSRVPPGSELVFQAPRPARFTLLRSGEIFRQLEGVHFTVQAEQEGIYRVLASCPDLPLDPTRFPWVISSPIYVSQ